MFCPLAKCECEEGIVKRPAVAVKYKKCIFWNEYIDKCWLITLVYVLHENMDSVGGSMTRLCEIISEMKRK